MDDDLLLIVMLLPAAVGLFIFFFTKQVTIKDRKMMPVTAARLMMSGHFIFSNRGVAKAEGTIYRYLMFTAPQSSGLVMFLCSTKEIYML